MRYTTISHGEIWKSIWQWIIGGKQRSPLLAYCLFNVKTLLWKDSCVCPSMITKPRTIENGQKAADFSANEIHNNHPWWEMKIDLTLDNWWWPEVTIVRLMSIQLRNTAREIPLGMYFDDSQAKNCRKCPESRGVIRKWDTQQSALVRDEIYLILDNWWQTEVDIISLLSLQYRKPGSERLLGMPFHYYQAKIY